MKLDFCADDIKFSDFTHRTMVVEVDGKNHLVEYFTHNRYDIIKDEDLIYTPPHSDIVDVDIDESELPIDSLFGGELS